jgi:uncharacterized lipoprotein YehR (DUF1307 family)
MKKIKAWFKEETVEKCISIIFIIFIAILLSASIAHAQTAPRDSTTTQTYTVKATGEKLAVFVGVKGGLYVWRTSAKGTKYRQYLPKEKEEAK